MNQLQNKIKLETLILILKNWDNLRREYQVVEAYLESLPRDLIALNIYQSKLHLLDGYNEKVLEKDLNGIKQRLDFYLPHLVKINKSLNNAVHKALKKSLKKALNKALVRPLRRLIEALLSALIGHY